MLTFSIKIKKELCANFTKSYKKALSEIAGIIKVMGIFNFNDVNKISFKISTDNKNIVEYVENIFSTYFISKFMLNVEKREYVIKNNNYILKIYGNGIVEFLENMFKLKDSYICLNEKFDCIVENKSFIRGVFVGCGSISNPEKNYHLEFVIQDINFAIYFKNLLNSYDLNSKIIERKGYHVVYIKESDNICKILGIMGAHNGVLEFENIRVDKEYSNNKNRLKNCIEANEDKVIIASVRQVRSIMFIDKKIGLNKLPKKLREIAEIRLKNKEISIKDLGMLLDPPLGKSGVLHRLKKIEKIAEDLEK